MPTSSTDIDVSGTEIEASDGDIRSSMDSVSSALRSRGGDSSKSVVTISDDVKVKATSEIDEEIKTKRDSESKSSKIVEPTSTADVISQDKPERLSNDDKQSSVTSQEKEDSVKHSSVTSGENEDSVKQMSVTGGEKEDSVKQMNVTGGEKEDSMKPVGSTLSYSESLTSKRKQRSTPAARARHALSSLGLDSLPPGLFSLCHLDVNRGSYRPGKQGCVESGLYGKRPWENVRCSLLAHVK